MSYELLNIVVRLDVSSEEKDKAVEELRKFLSNWMAKGKYGFCRVAKVEPFLGNLTTNSKKELNES